MKKVGTMFLLLSVLVVNAAAVEVGKYDAPGLGNPLVPGYFADPTIRRFGDTFYLYATTDGTAAGNGPAQVWVSKDFVNWTNLPMNWPQSKWIWAPEVVHGQDGRYYFYYSQPCQIHAGAADSPLGPWKSLAPDPDPNRDGLIVPDQYMPPVITLDWQMFRDDDDKQYGMFCTWAIYDGHGCGFVEVGKDMLPIDSTKCMVPNTQLRDIFEAPYMIKRNGIYYLMYSSGSCHDHTYRIQYATAADIMGPYTYDTVNNPILSTNQDGTIHGPGHHSVLQVDENYYIVYHRHDNPHSNNGMHRQIAADKIQFGPDNTIKPIVPTHRGIGYLGDNTNPFTNLTFTRPVTASSYYDERFKPAFAVDDNNGTLWKAAGNSFPQSLQVDLGRVQPVRRTWTQFQYPNWYYQYMIEYSVDGRNWKMFSDKRNNRLSGSPMVDFGDIQAHYLRLTITGLEKPGMYAAVWNFKAFKDTKEDPPQLLVHLQADDLPEGSLKSWPNNKGMLGGAYSPLGSAEIKTVDGRKAVICGPDRPLKFDKMIPKTLLENQIYTAAAWVKPSGNAWQYAAIVADGKTSKTYLNGQLKKESAIPEKQIQDAFNLQLLDINADIAIASLQIFARPLHASEITYLMESPYQKPADPSPQPQGLLVDLDASDLEMGIIRQWDNQGLTGESFISHDTTPMVEMVAGVKAVTFKGADMFKSTFPSPPTLQGNANYTVAVWAYNPVVDTAEFMVSWSQDGGFPATSAKLGYGRHDAFGATGHQGWADLNYQTIPAAGQWHHIAVTFDGSVEKIYVNGKLDNQEEKMLHVGGAREILLGRGHNTPEFFSGSLASVKLYDQALSPEKIAELAARKPVSNVLISLNTGGLDYGLLKALMNSGSLEGTFISQENPPVLCDVDGRIAIAFREQQEMILDTAVPQDSGYAIEAFVNSDKDTGGCFAHWKSADESIPAVWLPPHVKPGTWHHVIFTPDNIYVNGEKLPAIAGRMPEKEIKKGYKLAIGCVEGAIAKLAVLDRPVSEEQAKELYAAVTADLDAPEPCRFERTPDPVSSTAVVMTAQQANDAAGRVQYFFEEVSGNPGGKSSGWISENRYENWCLQADQEYAYTVRVRDYYGNVSKPSPVVKVRTDTTLFTEYYDDFNREHDYLANGTDGSIWDGLMTKGQQNMTVRTAEAENGKLRLESTGAIIDQSAGGPFLYKVVEGDFVAEAKVADFQGWLQRKPPGLLEPALMIRVADDEDAGPGQDHVRSGIFPYWNCGNLWTSLDGSGRPQGHNSSGYQADLYLQIQRSGEIISLRTSPDGKTWKPLPGTPIIRRDMVGLPLQVGLTQTIAENDETGWVDFDWFKVAFRQ